MKKFHLALALSVLLPALASAQVPAGLNTAGGAAPLALVQQVQAALTALTAQVADLGGGTGTTGTGSTGGGNTGSVATLPAFTQFGSPSTVSGGGTSPVSITKAFSGGNDLAAMVTPLPTSYPYTVTIKAGINIPNSQQISAGMTVVNSGQTGLWGDAAGGGNVDVYYWNSPNNYTSSDSGTNAPTYSSGVTEDVCFKYVATSASLVQFFFSESCNANDFHQSGDNHTAASLNNPDKIGLFTNPQSSGSGALTILLKGYSVETTADPQGAGPTAVGAGSGSGSGSGTGSTTTAGLYMSGYQNVLHQIDAASPVVTTATPLNNGIQIDATNGGIANIVDTKSSEVLDHGYGEAKYIATGGLNNGPFIRSAPSNYNNGYDGIRWPTADVDPIMGPVNNPFTATFVMRQTSGGGNDLLKFAVGNTSFVLDIGGVTTDGAFYVSQSNGSNQGGEVPSALSALNQWEIVTLLVDGTHINVYRNGTRVLQSSLGSGPTLGGFGTGAATYFAILNNANTDIRYAVIANGGASIAQMNAENANMVAAFGVTGVGQVTVGPSAYLPPQALPTAAQTFSNYIVTANRPNVADPVDSSAKPYHWPSSDTGNLTNFASFVFGSGTTNEMGQTPNITSMNALRSHVEMNQINGTEGLNYSNDNAKQANLGNFYAEFRVYPDGDAHQTVLMTPAGVQLKAYCAANGGASCQGQAGVVTGMIRPETILRPGDVLETCYRVPGSSFTASWPTNWVTGGWLPQANDTTTGYYTNGYPRRPSNYLEIDWPDHYPPNDGTAPNYSLSGSLVTALNDGTNSPRQGLVNVNGNWQNYSNYATYQSPFTTSGAQGPGVNVDLSAAPHCYQMEMVDAVFSDPATRTNVTTPGHAVYSFDGQEYSDVRYNYVAVNVNQDGSAITDGSSPAPVFSHMVALQYAAGFDPSATAAMTPATVNNAVEVISSIRYWHRTPGTAHAAPTLAAN